MGALMRVCLDARGNHFGGVLTYSKALIKNISLLKTTHDYVVLIDKFQEENSLIDVCDFEYVVCPSLPPLKMVFWNNVILPKLLKRENIDIYHGLKHFPVVSCGAIKILFTLHTASWWLHPELISRKELLFWKIYYYLGARNTDCMIMVSEYDRNAAVRALGIEKKKTVSIHLAPSEHFKIIKEKALLTKSRNRYGLPDKFIFFVGTIYPFKNVKVVILSFHEARRRGGIPHKLVLAGGVSKAYGEGYKNELLRLVNELKIYDSVIWLGEVSSADLVVIYNLAELMVFPSIYESFGLPAVEAMACGVPTIVSDEGGLLEVVGSAARIHKYNDVESIASSILEILSSHELRQSLIEKCYRRAKTFSWQKCAMETIAVYEKIFHS